MTAPRKQSSARNAHPLTAAIFCGAGPVSVALVRAWLDAGHALSAVIVGHPDPTRRSRWQAFVDEGVTVIGTPYPVNWAEIEHSLDRAAPDRPDVLLCYAFMRKIPAAILQRFRCGGLNFHPSLLPHYHGPNPMKCLVADHAVQQHGGVTLHCMSDRYDSGDIVAQLRMTPAEFVDYETYRTALATHLSQLATNAVPNFCAGTLTPVPQVGNGIEARDVPDCIPIEPQDWLADEIVAACALLDGQSRLELQLVAGTPTIPIRKVLSRQPQRAAKPARIGPVFVRCDCADARVTLLRDTLAGRIVGQAMTWLRPQRRNPKSKKAGARTGL